MGGVPWTQKPRRPKLPFSREKMIELGVEALPFSTAAFIKVPTGSPSRGGDVAVCVFDMNQPSLPTPFWSALVSVSVLMALSTVFHIILFFRQLSAFSLCSSGLISALFVLSSTYLFTKLSLSPDKIICG